ncbi:MAG TPA: helix-turn-helix transcriptional regulator [Streptosporangiaceae bacterium]|nr:helix-turn-helix transcriptional regulator [Streptosporangiaceae bacterium]
MTVKNGGNPAMHFGKQMKKERLARGWSLTEFAHRTGLNAGHLSRIENGKRPPTENVAAACDTVFAERKGWFTEYYEELRGWSEVPAAFRSWAELEEKAAALRVWKPGIVHGSCRVIQLQVSVSTYCYHPGSNGPGSEKPWIDSTFA